MYHYVTADSQPSHELMRLKKKTFTFFLQILKKYPETWKLKWKVGYSSVVT